MSTQTIENDDENKTDRSRFIPVHFLREETAFIPPDSKSVSVVGRDSDGAVNDFTVTMRLTNGNGPTVTVPIDPATPLDLTGYQNREVTFALSGLAANATNASILLRLNDGEGNGNGGGGDGGDLIWTLKELPYGIGCFGIAFGAEKFIAVGRTRAIVSDDAENWTLVNLPISALAISYGQGRFIALEGSKTAAVSTNGIEWETLSLPEHSTGYGKIAFGNGVFVAVTSSTSVTRQVAVSEDGLSWTTASLPRGITSPYIGFTGGKFTLSTRIVGTIMVSDNGSDWTESSVPRGDKMYETVCNGGDKILLFSSPGDQVLVSQTGLDWKFSSLPASESWSACGYGDGRYVAIANDSANAPYSIDGDEWKLSTIPLRSGWNAIAYGLDRFIAVTRIDNQIAIGRFPNTAG